MVKKMTACLRRDLERARSIERVVRSRYLDDDADAADLALVEIDWNPDRTDDEIARAVAQRIQQP